MAQLTDFGKVIRKIRIDKDMSIFDMSQKVGVSSAYISYIEVGKKKLNMDTVNKFIDALKPLSKEEEKSIEESAKKTMDVVSISADYADDLQSDMVFSLARKMNSMNNNDIEKILKILNGGSNG